MLFVALFSTAMASWGSGCSSNTSSEDEGTGGSVGTGGSGNPRPTCGQTCQDYLVGLAVNDTVWFLWNQNIAGRPVGNIDVSASCPLGGSAHITGMTSITTSGARNAIANQAATSDPTCEASAQLRSSDVGTGRLPGCSPQP